MQYRLSLIDAMSAPAKAAGAAGRALAGALKAVGDASGASDSATSGNAESIRKMYSELGKAESELKGLQAAQKKLGSGGSTDVAQWRMLQAEIDKTQKKIGAINSSIVQSGGATFDVKKYDADVKKAEDAAKKQKQIEEKKKADASKASSDDKKRLQFNTDAQNNILMAGAKKAAAMTGLGAAESFIQLGLGYAGMARLAGITARAQYNMRGLFQGTNPKPMLDSLDRMVGMLSPASNTGKALGEILRGSFNAIGKAIEFVTPFAERFFAGMILGGKLARLGFTYIEYGVLKLIAMIPGAAAMVSKFGTGWGPFAAGAAVAGTMLTALAVKAVVATAPLLAMVAAATLLSTALKELSDAWDENSLNQIGNQVKADLAKVGIGSKEDAEKAMSDRQGIVTGDAYDKKYKLGKYAEKPAGAAAAAPAQAAAPDPKAANAAGQNIGKQLGAGMVAGMVQTMPEVKAAGANLAAAAEQGATQKAEIHSPSDVMRKRVGWQLGAGVKVGILNTEGDIRKAAEKAFVPDISAAMPAPTGPGAGAMASSSGGGGRTAYIDMRGATIMGIDDFAQRVKGILADEFTDVREMLGAAI